MDHHYSRRSFCPQIIKKLKNITPGLIVVSILAFAAEGLSEHYGAPVMLMALLLGMATNFLYLDQTACTAGIELSSKRLLRIGVALLGLQISLNDLITLGFQTVGLVTAATISTILFGILASRALKRSIPFGILTGGAVGICGASAALAISAVLTEKKASRIDVVYTIALVTALSSIAMVIYPILMGASGMAERTQGIFLGATIHDVAQVVGAGYAVSDAAGKIATTVKLLRVMLLFPLVIVIAIFNRDQDSTKSHRSPVPMFVLAFGGLVALNSLDVIPGNITSLVASFSRWLLVVSIAAIGMMTSLRNLVGLGPLHLTIIISETVWLAAIVFLALYVYV